MKYYSFIWALAAVGCLVVTGCEPETKGKTDTTVTSATKGDDHDHDHEHGEDHEHVKVVHGAHGGHVFGFEGHPEKNSEFCYSKDNSVIRVYIMDGESKEVAPIKATSILVRSLAGKEPVEFKLEAVNPTEDGMAGEFMIDDEELTVAIFQGCEIIAMDGETQLVSKIPAHERHEH